MSRRYPGEDVYDHEDRVTAEAIQNDMDASMEAKRAAAGISPEALSLQDAFIEGQRAGHLGLSAGLNPYQTGCLEHHEWERARSCVIGAFLNGSLRRIA